MVLRVVVVVAQKAFGGTKVFAIFENISCPARRYIRYKWLRWSILTLHKHSANELKWNTIAKQNSF